jgi:hypothetical protein
MTSIRSTQEVKSSSQTSQTMTDAYFDLDNRICYKKRREELNKRVKSLLEQKKQITGQKIREKN